MRLKLLVYEVLTLVPRDSGGVANGGVDVGQPVFTGTKVPILAHLLAQSTNTDA